MISTTTMKLKFAPTIFLNGRKIVHYYFVYGTKAEEKEIRVRVITPPSLGFFRATWLKSATSTSYPGRADPIKHCVTYPLPFLASYQHIHEDPFFKAILNEGRGQQEEDIKDMGFFCASKRR